MTNAVGYMTTEIKKLIKGGDNRTPLSNSDSHYYRQDFRYNQFLSRNSRFGNRSPSISPSRSPGRGKCYRCGGEEHFRRDCKASEKSEREDYRPERNKSPDRQTTERGKGYTDYNKGNNSKQNYSLGYDRRCSPYQGSRDRSQSSNTYKAFLKNPAL